MRRRCLASLARSVIARLPRAQRVHSVQQSVRLLLFRLCAFFGLSLVAVRAPLLHQTTVALLHEEPSYPHISGHVPFRPRGVSSKVPEHGRCRLSLSVNPRKIHRIYYLLQNSHCIYVDKYIHICKTLAKSKRFGASRPSRRCEPKKTSEFGEHLSSRRFLAL